MSEVRPTDSVSGLISRELQRDRIIHDSAQKISIVLLSHLAQFATAMMCQFNYGIRSDICSQSSPPRVHLCLKNSTIFPPWEPDISYMSQLIKLTTFVQSLTFSDGELSSIYYRFHQEEEVGWWNMASDKPMGLHHLSESYNLLRTLHGPGPVNVIIEVREPWTPQSPHGWLIPYSIWLLLAAIVLTPRRAHGRIRSWMHLCLKITTIALMFLSVNLQAQASRFDWRLLLPAWWRAMSTGVSNMLAMLLLHRHLQLMEASQASIRITFSRGRYTMILLTTLNVIVRSSVLVAATTGITEGLTQYQVLSSVEALLCTEVILHFDDWLIGLSA